MPKLFSCKCFNSKAPEILRMDYSHRGLREVPAEIFVNERTLEELNLEYNNIDQLRKELFCCRELRKINLSDNEIRDIPVAVGNLNNLQELAISKNNIEEISENISQCKQLTFLDISVNPMGKLPDGVTKLSNLTELLLNDCFLTFLTGTIGRLTNLKVLELRENQLKTLPSSIGRLTSLERLDVGSNELTELPPSFGDLSSLLEFWCDQNELTQLPQSMGNLKSLMFIDLSRNELASLPPEIGSCSVLSDLLLSSNHIAELPATIGSLTNLSTFYLESNQLMSLPDSIGNMNSLSEFSVSNNYLECLPPNIGLLRNLRVLYADNNRLRHLPPNLGSCSGITVLSLRGNLLTDLPEELSRIPKLRVLNLSNNQLRSLPFNFIRFKQLQALWLSDNQSQPLVQLQQDRDIETGERCLVCYLLPQMTGNRGDVTPRGSNGCHEESPAPSDDRQRIIRFDCESDHENARQPIPKDFPDPSRARLAALRHHRLSACSPTQGGSHEKIYSSIQHVEQNHNLIKTHDHQHYPRYFQMTEEQTPNNHHLKSSQGSSSQQEIIYSTTYDKPENVSEAQQHNINLQNYIQRSVSHNGSFQVPPPPGYVNNHRILNQNAEITTAVPSQGVFNSQGSFRSSGSSISNTSGSVVQGRRVLSASASTNQRLNGSIESLEKNLSQISQDKETPTKSKFREQNDQSVEQLLHRSRHHQYPTGYESDTAAFAPRSSNRAIHPSHRNHLSHNMTTNVFTNGDKSGSNRTLTNYSVSSGPEMSSNHVDFRADCSMADMQHLYMHQMLQMTNGSQTDGYCTDTAAIVCRKPPQAARRRSPHQTVMNQRPPLDRKTVEMAINQSNNSRIHSIRQSNSVQTSVSSMTSSSASLKGSNSLPGFTANWIPEPGSRLTNGGTTFPNSSSAQPPNPLDGLAGGAQASFVAAGGDLSFQRPLPPPPAPRAEPERTSLSSDSGYSPSGGLGRNNLPNNGQLNVAIPGLNSSLPAPLPPVRSPPPLPDEDSGGPSPAPGSSLQGGRGSSCGEEERLTINNQSVLLPQGMKKEVELTIVIQKNPGLGFSIVGGLASGGNPYKPNDAGIFVTKVNNPGPAHGVLLPGDKILNTDGIDLSHVDHKKAVTLLKSGGQEVTLCIQRSIDSCTSDI